MLILEDTRNQLCKHDNIHQTFQKHGINFDRCRLYVGDYIVANKGGIAVDTKMDVVELAQDLHKDHERFRDELDRAQAAGIKLYILVEEKLPAGGMINWKPPKGRRLSGVQLRREMITLMTRYGCEFRFCAGDDTGETLLKLLGVDSG